MYIVEVELYSYDVYILKFYLKAHRQSDNKFSLLSNDNDAQGVIRTVLDIALEILEYENPRASFGFVGSHKISKKGTERIENTQRFRVYRDLMRNYFGDLTWHHYESINSSSYLMLNSCHTDPDEKIAAITEMFKGIYEQFEGSTIRLNI